MKKPTKEEAQSWIDFFVEESPYFVEEIERGEAVQSTHTSLASDLSVLGRAKYLHGDPLDEVRDVFKQAAEHMEMSFVMAYDESSPSYLGNTDKVDWSCVMEIHMLEMMAWALISHDFDRAVHLAQWVRPSPDDDPMDEDVCNFVYGLRDVLLDNWAGAAERLGRTFKKYGDHPPKDDSFRENYFTLSVALAGILEKNDELFNLGLAAQLRFYRSYAEGEAADTDEQYFCDNALAIAILGKRLGRTIELKDQDYLPLDLI